MTIKADRSVQAFLRRLEDFHMQGGPSAFLEICRDISAGELIGTSAEFVQLWELLITESKHMGLIASRTDVKNAIKHVTLEKDRVAPKREVAPALFAVKARKHRRN